MKTNEGIPLSVSVRLEGRQASDPQLTLNAYVFSVSGKLIDTVKATDKGERLSIPRTFLNKTIRVLIAPEMAGLEKPDYKELVRLGAYESNVRFRDGLSKYELLIPLPFWKKWPWCICHVVGKVVKQVMLPDGSTRDLPIAHARVKICEIDRFWLIVKKLPDWAILKLRDDLLEFIKHPRIPDPIGPWPPLPDPPQERYGPRVAALGDAPAKLRSMQVARSLPAVQLLPEHQKPMTLLATTNSIEAMKGYIAEVLPYYKELICRWHWLEPLWIYIKHCFLPVETDEFGRFSMWFIYDCHDTPDLYFSVTQWNGTNWHSIYAPSIRCGTHWNYECGSEVTIYVTDPSAIPSVPPGPVTPPDGILTWVMPYKVGGMGIWGNPHDSSSNPIPVPGSGWLKPSGLVDYSGFVDAPFGSTLGFRLGYSEDIPSAGIKYYRFSFKKIGDLTWTPMNIPVVRHYVKQSPGHLPKFPAYLLGPKTINNVPDLFEFKPDSPPGAEPTDPTGTITYWPEDNWFDDIYAAFWNTLALPGGVASAAGTYEVKVEVFNQSGAQVNPGAPFTFIVPTTADDTDVEARAAEAGEIASGAFLFKVLVDNNHCTASIANASLAGGGTADNCGFLRYDPAAPLPVRLSFSAQHPNGYAVFSFSGVRGLCAVGDMAASGEVLAAHAGHLAGSPPGSYVYTNSGTGVFTGDLPMSSLMNLPCGNCTNAAFAEYLYVTAKATNGWVQLNGYDASALAAFALATNVPSSIAPIPL